MLNYIWAGMILLAVIFGSFNGKMANISSAAIDSAKEAVTLCIAMLGVVGLWTGLMEIAKKSGLIDKLTKGLSPFISFMFPHIPKGHKSLDYISCNTIANILGLGWAATPAGLKAMEELSNLEKERTKNPNLVEFPASDEMCTFLILNISSLQLIPVNIIAYRSQYGSANPTSIIVPALIATFFSTFVGVIFCKIIQNIRRRKV